MGLMIAQEAALAGARTIALDPSADAPVFAVTNEHIVAGFDNLEALDELCRRSDVVTYEFENVRGEVLSSLAARYNIKQGIRQLLDSQDRLREKQNARRNGLKTPRFEAVDSRRDLDEAVKRLGYPCVFKTRTFGYDGHGQVVLRSNDDLSKTDDLVGRPAIVEEYIDFDFEASVVAVADGKKIITFPVGRNVHRDGILDLSVVPAECDAKVADKMVAATKKFMRKCRYQGILAIEYFVKGNEIFFNEMAPRPHNSGHYTIEGCDTNQFRELCRYLLGEPLQEPHLLRPTVMKNILGRDLDVAQEIAAENRPDVHVHLYGKKESRPLRKMGHITFVGTTAEDFDKNWKQRFK